MNIRSIALSLFSSLISSPFLLAQDKSDSRYTIGERTRDGIGKYYLGREIAQVMGHQGISWLERDTREAEEAPSKAIEVRDLKPDTIIADIGAGSGFYSFRLAKLLPQGKVIAVDIQQEMLDFLAKRAKETNTANVQPHMGSIESIQLPENSIDATLFVDAYHEFSHPFEMMSSILKALRPGGIVYLLEYRAEDQNVPIKPLHKMSQTQARKEMALVGFEWVENKKELPWQHLMIFKKPE